MPLRRIELFNFKSYRGTQVISLGDASFTCIIGPNGAGKSNLMDAISFVLGIRSSQLRSAQLKDLVYRGRKALQVEGEDGMEVDEADETQEAQGTQSGADARSAWVMAVYEDEKGKEWKFRRSVNTSGQSTYYLNSKAVPLQQYNGQLEKFNILVKAKNFLVFQGDVEGVASQDSKALARLIDRISGSAEHAAAYEAAKESQHKATDASTANYAKKRGMLTEAKHFKEQREEIRRWEKLRDEKDAMIQRHLLWKLYHITQEIEESTKKVEEANDKLSDGRDAVDSTELSFKNAKKAQAVAQNDVKKRESRVKKAEKAYEDKKPELLAIETKMEHSQKKAKDSSKLVERIERDEKRQADDLEELQKGAKDIERSMKEAAERQRKKSSQSGKALSKADLDQYRTLRSQANTLAVSERQQLEGLRREQRSLQDALASAEDKVQQAERQRAKLSNEIDQLAERDETMSERTQTLDKERDSVRAQLESLQAERQRLNMKETEVNERLQDTFNKLIQAGADKRETDRETKLKETLSSLRRLFPGVHGRVVDLCRPTATKYATAVMTVLGRNIDSIVVDTEKVAIQCIEYMRNQRAGQATFIPLDTIQNKPVPAKLREFKGAKLAIDCIEFRPDVERGMQHACGTSLICETMAIARSICYEKNVEVKAVTLEGNIIHKSGLITGGTGSTGTRKFNDEEVDKFRALKDTYMKQLSDLQKNKPNQKADEALLSNLARLDAEYSLAKDDLDATQLRLRGLKAELKAVDGDIKKMRPDLEKKSKAAKAAEDKISGLQAAVDSAEEGVFGAFCKKIKVANIREYEDVQVKMAKEESEAMEGFSQSQARIGHQIEFQKQQLENTRDRLKTLRATVDRATAQLDMLEADKTAIEDELEALEGQIETQREKLAESQATLDETTEAVETARTAHRKAQRSLDKALKEIAGWNDEIEKVASDRHAIYRRCRLEEIELPLVKGTLDKVPIEENLGGAAEEMEVDDDGTQRPKEVADWGVEPDFEVLEDDDKENNSEEVNREFEGQISKLKADLEKLVPNMKAIDRLADVQANLDDVEKEAEAARRDSKRAKDDFQELKKKRFELFTAAYEHMSGCIDKIYKDLTKSKTFPTGGVGFLSLEDNEEPYLSGVKYNVMPPGKRFVEMEQLSGGEKTMAALALLFAIHSFHPAPFFVLDEVDAALDPTNVSKLARYIRSQAEKEVQFLIISLKSSLYENADGLVGVYRDQDENSSRSLTLDLRKYAE